MVTKTIATTEGNLTISIPTTHQELTLEKMIALQELEAGTDRHYLSILSGIPYDTLLTVRHINDLEAFTRPIMMLCNSIKYLYDPEATPKSVTFTHEEYFISVQKHQAKPFLKRLFSKPPPNQTTVEVFKNLSIEPAGAYLNAREIIADEINDMIKKFGEDNWRENMNPSLRSMGMILAHYFYERVTGKVYDERKAEQFYDVIKRMSVADAVPIGRYFFLKYPDLSNQKISFWDQVRLYSRKRRVLRNSRHLNTSTR